MASSHVDIRDSYGAAFVGLLVSTTLFGVTIVQTWIYFWHYRNRDSKALKFFIVFVTILDALHTALCARAIYWYLVLNFGNVENLQNAVWTLELQLIISICLDNSVRLYYTRRVFIVSQSIICSIVIAALVATASAFGLLFVAKQIVLKQFSTFHSLTWITCVGLTAGALADLLIAATMCWSLYRRKTGIEKTDSMIMTLMAYSINSSLLTSLLGVAMTISFVVSPSSLICTAIHWTMSKCYVNSLLAMLNSRDYVCDRSTTDNPDNAFDFSSIRIEPSTDAYGSKSVQPRVTVTVHRSATLTFGWNNSDHGIEPSFEVPRPDAISQSQGQTSEPSV